MKVWTDRDGKKVDAKEFVARWKEGITNVTPLQLIKMNNYGYFIVLIGIIIGIIISAINSLWWLFIILIGSLIVSGTATLGNFQKYLILNRIQKEMKGGEDGEKYQNPTE